MPAFDVQEFLTEPSLPRLTSGTVKKNDWLAIALAFEVPVNSGNKKAVIKDTVLKVLVQKQVLPATALDLCEHEGNLDAVIKLKK